MKNPRRLTGLAFLMCAWASGALSTSAAMAQEEVDETLGEIIVVGSRRSDRTATNTPLPIDVFSKEDLEGVSSPELLEVLQTLVPSLTLERFVFGDGKSFIRAPSMRGLNSDKTLVLVNGKRRHRGALVQLSDSGSHGTDFASIPSIALRNVEVLRDGASAMYGSDAVAGVMNLNLKNASSGGELQAQYGQWTIESEQSVRIAGNVGLPLGSSGFINISAEWNDVEQTSRGGVYDRTIAQSGLSPAESALVSGFYDHDGDPNTPDVERFGPDALTEVFSNGQVVSIFGRSDGIPDDSDSRYADNLGNAEISDSEHVILFGQPERTAFHTVINAGYDLSNGSSIYAWANFSDSDINRNSAYRRPGTGPLSVLRLPDASIYDPRTLYPAAFTPRFFGNVTDRGLTGGWRGEANNGLGYDFGGRYGRSEIKYSSKNTMNPSLGPDTPTAFSPGNLISDEAALTADFTLPLSLGFANESFLAFGAEFRTEGYKNGLGDPQSYEVGPYGADDPWDFETSVDEAADGQNGGVVECRIPGLESVGTPCPDDDPIHNVVNVASEGFPGYSPATLFDYDRDSWAVYADIETDFTDQFLLTLAARYEDYSDFGDNLSGRIAGRYRFNDALTLRGSFGTGFKAPTPGQIATLSVQGRPGTFSDPFLLGIFPADHPAAMIFGAVPLDSETSTQWSFGLTATPTDNFTFTLDFYGIQLDDRLFISPQFNVGAVEQQVLIDSGVPAGGAISRVQFFNNDIDTRTDGIDLVATYNIDWASSVTTVFLNANWNRTEVTRRTPRPDGEFLDDDGVFGMENELPRYRANLGLRHSWSDNWMFSIRGNLYGDYRFMNSRDATQIQNYDALWQVDFNLNWNLADGRYSIMFGGNNIFDEQPDPAEFSNCCGIIVDLNSVMDWQGPFYYLRGTFRFME